MPKKNELKLGNPQISIIRKWANFSEPWNLTILEDAMFQLFFSIIPEEYQKENRPVCLAMFVCLIQWILPIISVFEFYKMFPKTL